MKQETRYTPLWSAVGALSALSALSEVDVKRKGSQQGTLQQRDGKWIAHFSTWRVSKEGRYEWARTSQTIGNVKDLSERKANAALAVLVDEANRRAKQPFVLMSLGEFIEKRFVPQWVATQTERGKEHYRYMLDRFIMPGMGHIAIDDLNVDRVQTFLSALQSRKTTRRRKIRGEWVTEETGQSISIQTIHHVKNALSAVFSHMERLELWTKVNPCRKVILPDLKNEKRVALTEAQVDHLVMELERAGDRQTALLVLFLAWTGCRISEAIAFRWKWINFEATPKNVDGVWLLPERGMIQEALSHGSWSDGKTGQREIIVPAHVRERLMLHRKSSQWAGDEQFVFSGRTGKPLDEHNELRRNVKPALKRAGLPNIGWHDLRHTFQTIARNRGISQEQCMLQMGHRDPKMAQHYTHPDLESVVNKLSRETRVVVLESTHTDTVQ